MFKAADSHPPHHTADVISLQEVKVALWIKAMNKTYFLKCIGVSVTEGLLEHLPPLGCRTLEGVSSLHGGVPAWPRGLCLHV